MTQESPVNVLLVEDNPGDADLVRLRLVEGRSQVNVNCVGRLSDALSSISNQEPALVLLDLNLPDSHGAETFRKILKNAPNVPIVVLSGSDDEALAISALQQGAQDYLVKGGLSGKQLERSLRYAIERQSLIRALEMTRKEQLEFKNRLLSHVSHELRTPLTCIHQYVSLIADGLAGAVNPEQMDHLAIALQGVSQLQAMIRDLLEASRAESGKLRVDPRCIAVSNLAAQATAMLQPAAQQKGVNLDVQIEAGLPLVCADPDRVLEVLINLIHNAIKFTPAQGSVVVKVSLAQTDPENVYVSVADTGSGISAEARPLIFERFYQESGSTDSGSRMGLGLGLFISRELIRLHNGRIWFTSEAGSGTTFTFTMPVYSLAKLLSPVAVHQGRLRASFVLIQVVLSPMTGGTKRKDMGRDCLETLRRCVYLDKDLVLPPMGMAGAEETFFVVAATDLDRSAIMTTRIREQLERISGANAKGAIAVKGLEIKLPHADPAAPVDQQVQAVAAEVNAMVMQIMDNRKMYARQMENHKLN